MTQQLLWLFWLGVVVVGGAHLYRGHLRRRRLARLAGSCSLTYSSRDSLGLADRYATLRLFQQGHDRYVHDVFTGVSPAGRVQLFSYAYDLGFGSDRRHVRWTVGVVETHRIYGRISVGEAAELPFAFAARSPEPPVWAADDASPAAVSAVQQWVSAVEKPCRAEVADRFVAVYLLQDNLAGLIETLLADLTDLANRLDAAEPDTAGQ